jgi:hypothetical protein
MGDAFAEGLGWPDALLLEVTPLGERLVAEGWGGSRPLAIEACRGCGRWGHAGCAFLPTSVPRRALALWWEGGWSSDSWDRLRRAWFDHEEVETPDLTIAFIFDPDLAEAIELLRWAERSGLGRPVQLSATGEELALDAVPPPSWSRPRGAAPPG